MLNMKALVGIRIVFMGKESEWWVFWLFFIRKEFISVWSTCKNYCFLQNTIITIFFACTPYWSKFLSNEKQLEHSPFKFFTHKNNSNPYERFYIQHVWIFLVKLTENLNRCQIPISCSLAMQRAFKWGISLLYGGASNRDECEKHGFWPKMAHFGHYLLKASSGARL